MAATAVSSPLAGARYVVASAAAKRTGSVARWSLPVRLRGMSGTIAMRLGTLCAAMRANRNSRNASATSGGVAAEGSVFGVFCRRFGVPLIDLGTVRLPRLIGASRAMDLILTGRPVSAQEAHDIGLANRLAPKGGALDAALELAAQLSAFPQLCMRNDRLSAIDQWSLDWDQAQAREIVYGMETLRSGASREGAARFAAGEGRGGKFS